MGNLNTSASNGATNVVPFNATGWQGEKIASVPESILFLLVERLPDLVGEEIKRGEMLQDGRNRTVKLTIGRMDLVVKLFPIPSAFKQRSDQHFGSKARRAFLTHDQLMQAGVGTPLPIAYLEPNHPVKKKDTEIPYASIFVSAYADKLTCFKDELIRLWNRTPSSNTAMMSLLETVANAVQAMHDAGVIHRDLGNQNILLRRTGDTAWADVQFIDLNRAKRLDRPATPRERGQDLSRIALPSDLRRVFFEMVFAPDTVPAEFKKSEKRSRSRFDFHTKTRALRHPIRSRKNPPQPDGYPPEKDMAIWDERSKQPVQALRSRDRLKHHSITSHLKIAALSLKKKKAIQRTADQLLREVAFKHPVQLSGKIGLTLECTTQEFHQKMDFLKPLGRIPLLLRVYHHEAMGISRNRLSALQMFCHNGHKTALSFCQDRRAITRPQHWKNFTSELMTIGRRQIEFCEIGHAINRVKWGLWDIAEYRSLARPFVQNAELRYTGPAVIDYEPHYILAGLKQLQLNLHALSHHLYVDRRGAPENKQAGESTLEKLAKIKAVAQHAPNCNDRVFITEFNWPLQGTGAYSPVTSPYDSPGIRENDPNVSPEFAAAYMIRYLLITLCSGLADRAYFWTLDAHGFGLIDDQQTPWKPRAGYHALRYFLQTLGEATFVEKLDTAAGVHLYRFESPACIIGYCEDGTDPSTAASPAHTKAVDMCGQVTHRPTLSYEPTYFTL